MTAYTLDQFATAFNKLLKNPKNSSALREATELLLCCDDALFQSAHKTLQDKKKELDTSEQTMLNGAYNPSCFKRSLMFEKALLALQINLDEKKNHFEKTFRNHLKELNQECMNHGFDPILQQNYQNPKQTILEMRQHVLDSMGEKWFSASQESQESIKKPSKLSLAESLATQALISTECIHLLETNQPSSHLLASAENLRSVSRNLTKQQNVLDKPIVPLTELEHSKLSTGQAILAFFRKLFSRTESLFGAFFTYQPLAYKVSQEANKLFTPKNK